MSVTGLCRVRDDLCKVARAAMKIGVAKEIKTDEYRVALTPAGALELIRRGHDVSVETGAGLGSALPDGAYERVGARIASVDEVWNDSELLLKVKEPVEAEYPRLRDGLVLFTYLHIAAVDRSDGAHGRGSLGRGELRMLVEPPVRGVDHASRCRDRRGLDSRREGAEADHPADAPRHEGRRRLLRRRD